MEGGRLEGRREGGREGTTAETEGAHKNIPGTWYKVQQYQVQTKLLPHRVRTSTYCKTCQIHY